MMEDMDCCSGMGGWMILWAILGTVVLVLLMIFLVKQIKK